MAKQIKTGATVASIKRIAGKPAAQVTLTIPAAIAGSFPIGEVMLTVEPAQGELELGGGKVTGDRG